MHYSSDPIYRVRDYLHFFVVIAVIVQALISVQALVFDLAQLTCQKRFDCRNAIFGSSAILLRRTVKLW